MDSGGTPGAGDAGHAQVAEWLRGIGLGHHAGVFAEHKIGLDLLPDLGEADLKEIGVTAMGERKLLLREATKLKGAPAPKPEPAKRKTGDTAPLPPTKVGHFEILEPIGRGGMGTVYRAWDSVLNRQVAVKLLDRSLAVTDPQFLKEFIDEAKSAASINDPHIVQIYFAGEEGEEHYIAMELLEGQNLFDRLQRGPVDERTVLGIAKHAVEALASVAERRLIHGDIKPHNIFITRSGETKLLDFGLSRKMGATGGEEGSIVGTAHYMSPERVQRLPEDFRSDIYSLGATLFEAVSGMPPFEAETSLEVARMRIRQKAPRVSSVKRGVSPELDRMLARMLEREPGNRYQSYEDLMADILETERAALAPPVIGAGTGRLAPPPPMVVPQGAVEGEEDVAGQEAKKEEAVEIPREKGPKRTLWAVVTDKKFLFVSIVAHVVFGLIAAYLVVQTVSARKLTFTAAPPSPNPGQRASEHRVQMAQKRKTMSMPTQAKRVTTTGMSKVALPDMPAMPGVVAPTKMAGMAGNVSFGSGLGGGGIGGGSGSGAGGGTIPFFGFKGRTDGLVGTFYDAKRTSKTKRNPDVPGWDGSWEGPSTRFYVSFISGFCDNGWAPKEKCYMSPAKLSSISFYFHEMPDTEAGKAFQSPETEPGMWLAHYKGNAVAPADGKYRLVGFADNVLVVRLKNQFYLDACWGRSFSTKGLGEPIGTAPTQMSPRGCIPFYAGPWFDVRKGDRVPIEVIFGDEGGLFEAGLFVEKKGQSYKTYPNGSPILPLFSIAPIPEELRKAYLQYLPEEALKGPFWNPTFMSR